MAERNFKFVNQPRAKAGRSLNRQERRSMSPDSIQSNRSSRDSSVPYTPPWLSPEERAKLRARVSRMRTRHMEQQQKKKEEETLLRARESSIDSKKSKSKSKASQKSTASVVNEDAKSDRAVLPVVPSDGSIKSRMSKKQSKDNLSKKPSEIPPTKTKSKENMKKREKKPKTKKNEPTTSKQEQHSPAYPSGNTMAPEEERQIHPEVLEEHIWATDYEEFDPQLYHFKSPEKLSTKNPVSVECPPFWVLLDHTIAVTWKLFNNKSDRKYLGIIPLQWSLEFVTAMKDERGGYLPAISRVKSAIEDALIDRYAKATDKGENMKGKNDEEQTSEREDVEQFSSDSIFKYNPEVSYTLKDMLSRNMPGRKPIVEEAIVHRVVPAHKQPPPDSGEIPLDKDDIMSYLRQLKMEQDAVIAREKLHAEKLDALMKLVSKGDVGPEMFFQEHEEDKPRTDRPKTKRQSAESEQQPRPHQEDDKEKRESHKSSPSYEQFKKGKSGPNRKLSQSSIQSVDSKISQKSKKSKLSAPVEPKKSKSSKRGRSTSSGRKGSTEEENT